MSETMAPRPLPRPILDEGREAERLSATPVAAPTRPRDGGAHKDASREGVAPSAPVRRAAAEIIAGPLPALQAWFAELMTHPDEIEAALPAAAAVSGLDIRDVADLDRVLTAGPRLAARERMEIYRSSYFARLVECLEDDYPAIAYAVGCCEFEALCRDYIVRHPSRHPNLNGFGQHFATFLRDERPEPFPLRDVLFDLARLEWALVEALHAPPTPALDPARLQAVPLERWQTARFVPAATLRVLDFGHPVNAFYQAWRAGAEPSLPGPAPSSTAVYRQGYSLWRMDLTPEMRGLLGELLAGARLGDALATLPIPEGDEAAFGALLQNAMVWFREWVSGGFFADILLDDEEGT